MWPRVHLRMWIPEPVAELQAHSTKPRTQNLLELELKSQGNKTPEAGPASGSSRLTALPSGQNPEARDGQGWSHKRREVQGRRGNF